MGLDIYLNVKHAIKAESEDNPQLKEIYDQIVNLLRKNVKAVEWKGVTWRNAYSINDWFATHVSENDTFRVPRPLLEKLRDDCQSIVNSPELESQILPKSDDEDRVEYEENVRFTLENLNRILEETNEYHDFFFTRSY